MASSVCAPAAIDHELISHEINNRVGIMGEFQDLGVKPSSSNNEGSSNNKEEDVLQAAKAEMGEVREENERLKMMLHQVERDYESLKLRFYDILQQENSKKSADSDPSGEESEEPELMSLRLGRTPTKPKDSNDKAASNSSKSSRENGDLNKTSLTLGLDSSSKFHMSTELELNPYPENSSEEVAKDDEAGETWPPSKNVPKRNIDDEVAQQSNMKKARVCVRARCDTPTMNDGCQWRKYGQKIAKGNSCPRAYYRCTVAPACPVRKQVQRCVEDMSILITTYEGTHNHPLPASAAAMASTTSAAASMLLSSSSASQPGLGSHSAVANSGTELKGLSFSLHDNSRSKQFYFTNPSSLFPTITIDLTASPSTSSTTTPFNRFSLTSSRFPLTGLSFSSTESNILPTIWGNGYQSNYGSMSLGIQNQQQMYQPNYMERINQAAAPQQALTETLTKAITSDPTLRTVIAAVISSVMGSSSTASASASASQGLNQLGTSESSFG